MEPKKFFEIIDGLAKDWLVDSVEPVKGTYRGPTGTASGPKRRTLHDGSPRENNDSGCVQIVEWQPRASTCGRCNKKVIDQTEEINLHKRNVKCHLCGQRYSLDVLNPFSIEKDLTK